MLTWRIMGVLIAIFLTVVKPPAPTYVGPARWQGSKTNKPVKRIVIHATAGAEPGTRGAARNTVNYSKNTSRPSSYHYIRDAFEFLQYVYDSFVAYGAPPNENTLHYEFCCSLSNSGKGHWRREDHQVMLREGAKDVAQLCVAYKIPAKRRRAVALRLGRRGVCGHVDVSSAWGQTSHWDPGPYFPWKSFMKMVRAEIALLKEGEKQAGAGTPNREVPENSEGTPSEAAAVKTRGRLIDLAVRSARDAKAKKGTDRAEALKVARVALRKVPTWAKNDG